MSAFVCRGGVLNRTRIYLHLWETEIDEYHTQVGEHCVEKEGSVAQLGDHVRSGASDAIVDDPVDEETETHTEGALGGCQLRSELSKDA